KAVDTGCTSSSFGKTACQAKFSSCAELELGKALAQSVSTDTATCLVDAIKAGASAATSSDGGGTGSEGGTGDGGGGAGTNIPNTGSFVAAQSVTGTFPTPTGGTVMPGTYTLTSVAVYSGTVTGTLKRTIKFGTSSLEEVSDYNDGMPERTSGIYIASGTT